MKTDQATGWLKSELGHAPCLADLARLDAKRFRAFMAHRRRAGLSSRSLARTMAALRSFFRWLEAEEVIRNRGVRQVALPKVPHGIPKPLTVAKAVELSDYLEKKYNIKPASGAVMIARPGPGAPAVEKPAEKTEFTVQLDE